VTVTDVKQTPAATVWGKLKRAIPEIGGVLSVRGEMDANQRDIVDLDIQASGYGTGIQLTGAAGTSIEYAREIVGSTGCFVYF
jgi:hypothetical protein